MRTPPWFARFARGLLPHHALLRATLCPTVQRLRLGSFATPRTAHRHGLTMRELLAISALPGGMNTWRQMPPVQQVAFVNNFHAGGGGGGAGAGAGAGGALVGVIAPFNSNRRYYSYYRCRRRL